MAKRFKIEPQFVLALEKKRRSRDPVAQSLNKLRYIDFARNRLHFEKTKASASNTFSNKIIKRNTSEANCAS